MTSDEVVWRLAVHPKDQEALSNFDCTPPPTRHTGGGGWKKIYGNEAEAYAQSAVRSLRTAKDNRGKRGIWIGEDGRGLVAVLAWEWQEDAHVHLNVGAIALRRRGEPGHQLSRGLVDSALQQLAGVAAEGLPRVELTPDL